MPQLFYVRIYCNDCNFWRISLLEKSLFFSHKAGSRGFEIFSCSYNLGITKGAQASATGRAGGAGIS